MGVVKDSSSDVQIAGIQKFETKDTTLHRRFSARLQKIPDDKKPFYDNDRKRMVDVNNETLCNKKAKVKHPKQACLPSACGKNVTEEDIVDESDDAMDVILKAGREKTVGAKGCESNWLVTGTSLFDAKGKSFSARVKKTLRTFNLHYLHFVQEEEKRCSTENGRAHENARKRTSKRPDLKAIKQMGENKEFLYTARRFGHIPGIKIGHKFFSRCEMVVVGFHMHWLSGIDYIGKTSGKRLKYKGYTFPLAVGIVLSGQYEDDVDYSEEIVYTGQGGNDLLGNKSQIKDQVMNRGNLALKNNMKQFIPVRVVRGHKCGTSYSKKVYTYDGLYEVVNHWKDKGAAGFIVYKYRLKRLPGQPNLESDQIHFIRGQVSKVQSELPQFVCQDISNGQEKLCIPATNAIDDPPVSPAGFTYVNHIQVERSINIPPNASGCNCEGTCSNAKTCSCARLNGSDFPYVLKNGGRLIEAMDVVFECGPNCGCGPDCINRISQRELKCKLEVYRSCNKGWAVRSWDFIPSGAPVCEYTGVLRKTDELDGISENDYIFEIDCWQTMNGLGGRERRLRDVHLPSDHSDERDNKKLKCVPEFAIDGGSSGNVSRFINHSCEPNLFVQCVLSSHHDVRFARIVLFAADNIAPMQELTYDYGYMLDSVKGPDGKIKTLPCYCGAAGCRKRLY